MSNVAASIIKFLHVCLVLFVTLVPLIPNVRWIIVMLHLAVVICLVVHWYVDNDTCALTLLECYLRGIPAGQSFMYQLVSPVYKINEESLKNIVCVVTPILGLTSFIRLWNVKDAILDEISHGLAARTNVFTRV